MDLFVKLNRDNQSVEYFLVGETSKKGFTGIVFGYDKGNYQQDLVFQDKILPKFDDNDDEIDEELLGEAFLALVDDEMFLIDCDDTIHKYLDYNPHNQNIEYIIKPLLTDKFSLIDNIIKTREFKPFSYYNTIFDKSIETMKISELNELSENSFYTDDEFATFSNFEITNYDILQAISKSTFPNGEKDIEYYWNNIDTNYIKKQVLLGKDKHKAIFDYIYDRIM